MVSWVLFLRRGSDSGKPASIKQLAVIFFHGIRERTKNREERLLTQAQWPFLSHHCMTWSHLPSLRKSLPNSSLDHTAFKESDSHSWRMCQGHSGSKQRRWIQILVRTVPKTIVFHWFIWRNQKGPILGTWGWKYLEGGWRESQLEKPQESKWTVDPVILVGADNLLL